MGLALGADVAVFERGWLSSNNILLHGADGEGATLVDSSHCLHSAQTLALVRRTLRAGESLRMVINTHLHSDHCGGNAALQRAFGSRLVIPPGQADAVAQWDENVLSYRATGQRMERFDYDALLFAGASITVGARSWQAWAAPGHDPHSLIFFDSHDGVLISADALWANGFGVVFPELDGDNAFDEVATIVDEIERMAPRLVIPGHGAPFTDVSAAVRRARSRLASFVAEPARHARHGVKVLIKYHLLEERAQRLPDLLAWCERTPLLARVWRRSGHPDGTVAAWCERLVRELVAVGALALRDAVVRDA
jgi:glyoxylase-like metal-dependent hydrolase (beta-lactamase superfamily II)